MSFMQRLGGGTVALALIAPVAIVSGYAIATNIPPVAGVAPLHMILPPDDTVAVCPGPVRTAGDANAETNTSVAYDPQFAPVDGASKLSTAFLTVSANSNSLSGTNQINTTYAAPQKPDVIAQALAGEKGDASSFFQVVMNAGADGIGVGSLKDADSSKPVSITSKPSTLGSAVLTALQTTVTPTGDLRSVALASCGVPQLETYLVGGRTDIGSSSRLILTNTSTRAASVTFDVWDQAGPRALGSLASVTVPAGSQRAILLEGQGRTSTSLGVKVASNVPLSATIQTSRLNGLVPAGLEMINATVEPDIQQNIAAVSVGATTAEAAAAPRVDVLVPGGTAGTVNVTALGLNGVAKTFNNIPVKANTVTPVSLAGLPAGEYSLSLTATVPMTAAARTTRTGTKNADLLGTVATPQDVAWSPASELLDGPAVVPLPKVGGTWQVDVGAVSGATAVTAIAIDANGATGTPVRINLADNSTAPIGVQALAASGIAEPVGVVLVPDLPGSVVAGVVLSVQSTDGELIGAAPLKGERYSQITADLRVQSR